MDRRDDGADDAADDDDTVDRRRRRRTGEDDLRDIRRVVGDTVDVACCCGVVVSDRSNLRRLREGADTNSYPRRDRTHGDAVEDDDDADADDDAGVVARIVQHYRYYQRNSVLRPTRGMAPPSPFPTTRTDYRTVVVRTEDTDGVVRGAVGTTANHHHLHTRTGHRGNIVRWWV